MILVTQGIQGYMTHVWSGIFGIFRFSRGVYRGVTYVRFQKFFFCWIEKNMLHILSSGEEKVWVNTPPYPKFGVVIKKLYHFLTSLALGDHWNIAVTFDKTSLADSHFVRLSRTPSSRGRGRCAWATRSTSRARWPGAPA